MSSKKTVFVGLSGGVDSSVTAALLKEQGHHVVGVHMKNWAQDLPGFECPWREDLADAKRVAVQLGIDFELLDFQDEYKEKVVYYLIDGYKQGLTPNPDIMCNQEIKFKLFYDIAKSKGADAIATGHYARTTTDGQLLRGIDDNKDQSYFLYRMQSRVVAQSFMPLGAMTKPEVRAKARTLGLVTAKKKESMGICFVGKVPIKDFLQQFVDTQPGPIIDQKGAEIGSHDGALFYTIGQRHGLNVGGGLPYYVAGKDMERNVVFVTTDLDDERLWSSRIRLTSEHWINDVPRGGVMYEVRTRHRAPLLKGIYDPSSHSLMLQSQVRALTPGQSTVIYDAERVVGGGIVVG